MCLDLEGVLVPEIWHAIARATEIEALNRTTRDIPVYDDLMQLRLRALERHDVAMSRIDEVIESLEPLPGAVEFMVWAQRRFQVAILSDTFYEFAMPLMIKLDYPFLLCHRLEIENDRIIGYRLRQDDPKSAAVRAFQTLNFRVYAVGDSYNDIGMLQSADRGYFFNAPERVTSTCPDIAAVEGYDRLKLALEEHL